ncbi:MAG TPA: AAA family ATPase [Candidatus Binatia bacterium]
MYNRYFGFLESPFSVTPDPRFFYTNSVYSEAYATLRYGIEAKKGFIVITGEVGTGKTTLLRKLLRGLEDSVHSVFIFNTSLSFPELLQVTLQDLGLAPKDASTLTMLQQLNEYLIEQLKRGHTVAALIDEAQNLSADVLENLRLLSNLETDREKLLQIVLVGQPELEAKLDQPGLRQLKQRVAVQCRLDPLKDEEVGPYINFRLRTAGYEGKDLFHRQAVLQVARFSKGIPRLMNIVCDNALVTAYAESKRTVSADMIKQVAKDLRIVSEPLAAAELVPGSAMSASRDPTRRHGTAYGTPQRKRRRLVDTGIATLLGILVLIALAAVIEPRNFLNDAGQNFEVVKHNLNQESVPKKAYAEVEPPRKDRITIQYGGTIYQIAIDKYGANAILGMDLIKEFNPQIENLNWVAAGQNLWLPSLTRETMLRKRSDGAYRLIVGSFRSATAAEGYARLLRDKRYQVRMTTRAVSDDLELYRVEIDGLKNLDEATHVWQTGLDNQWLAFAGQSSANR